MSRLSKFKHCKMIRRTIHTFVHLLFIENKAYWEIFLKQKKRFNTWLVISRTCRDHVRNPFNVLFLLNDNFFLLITSF